MLRRHPDNPILTPERWPYPINSAFNPGAIRLNGNGHVLLLVRVEDRRGISHLCSAISEDGVKEWQIDNEPTLMPDREARPEELWGIEDPRITWLPELRQYAVVYTAFSEGGPGVSLALTPDFCTYDHHGMVMSPDDKDAALFPRKFGGHWAMIHRPMPASGSAHIWISFSPDLRHWGSHRILLPARRGAWWDARKVGLSTPPVETPEGWLLFYHGVRNTAAGSLYRVGAALLDLDNPVKVIYRGSEWFFCPHEGYERVGDVGDVVFPTGCVLDGDGDTLLMYYGAADTTVGLAMGSLKEIVCWLKKNNYPGTT